MNPLKQYRDFTSAFGGTADIAGAADSLIPVENGDPKTALAAEVG
jgi:hypothetical protein